MVSGPEINLIGQIQDDSQQNGKHDSTRDPEASEKQPWLSRPERGSKGRLCGAWISAISYHHLEKQPK